MIRKSITRRKITITEAILDLEDIEKIIRDRMIRDLGTEGEVEISFDYAGQRLPSCIAVHKVVEEESEVEDVIEP